MGSEDCGGGGLDMIDIYNDGMSDDYYKEVPNLVKFIASRLGIDRYSLCFCGSGKKYGWCCHEKAFKTYEFESILWGLPIFEQTRNLIKSKPEINQIENLKIITGAAFLPLQKKSTERLKCLFPGCNQGTTNCHLVAKTILKKTFGDFCSESVFEAEGEIWDKQRGVSTKAGTKLVFCNSHDQVFRSIDKYHINLESLDQLFLLSFKTIPFSLRQTQIFLGLDSQAELCRPKLILNDSKKGNFRLDPQGQLQQIISDLKLVSVFSIKL